MFRVILMCAMVLPSHLCNAQNWAFNHVDIPSDSLPQKSFLQIRYQIGRLGDTKTAGIKYLEANPFQSLEVRYGRYGYGRKRWHLVHHYPTYGLGASQFFFKPSGNILGNPTTTYLFFNESVVRFRNSSLGYDFSMGLAYNWKPYNTQNNPDQLAIGSAITGFLGLALQYDFKLSDRFEGTLGTGIQHFSNGRMRSPNRGINLYGLNASIRYRLNLPDASANKSELQKINSPIERFRPCYEFYVVGSIGFVTTFQDRDNSGIYYMAGSASIDAARHYGYKGKYGVGFDWSYDESLKVEYRASYLAGVPTHLLYWPGVHLSHEYMIHRWTFITQAGVNLKTVGDKGAGYGRVAFRYDLSKHIFLRVGLRVYKSIVSDFIEWGVGYSVARPSLHL